MSKFQSAFGRARVSTGVLDARTASAGVHKSLFSNLQQIGFDGSSAALVAWALIKAVRPSMADHKTALRDVSERPAAELTELRAVAVKTSRSEKTSSSPARAELIGDVIAMLDGLMHRALAVPLALVGAAPRGPGLEDDDAFARRLARFQELVAGGMSEEAASLCVASELDS